MFRSHFCDIVWYPIDVTASFFTRYWIEAVGGIQWTKIAPLDRRTAKFKREWSMAVTLLESYKLPIYRSELPKI